MTIEGIENQKLTANLRVINTFITVLSIILSIWMALGDSVMNPLCELPVFVDRRESCFRNGALEMRDRFSVIILFLVTAAAAIFVRSDKAVKKLLEQNLFTRSIDILALIFVILAISTRSYYPSFDLWSGIEFSGFGWDVAFVIVLLLFGLIILQEFGTDLQTSAETLRSQLRIISITLIIILAIFYLPATIQLNSSLSSYSNSVWVFNELLAYSAGNFPLADSIPQYNSLMGLPIKVLSLIFGPESAFLTTPFWISFNTAGIVLMLVTIWRRLFPKTPKLIRLVGVISLLFARSGDLVGSNTLASFPSWTVRMALPCLTALLLHISVKSQKNKVLTPLAVCLGSSIALSLLNNFEFGLTCAFSVLSTLFILKISDELNWKFVFSVLLGVFLILFSFYIFYVFNDKTINIEFYTLVARGFGANGFGSWPMPTYGFFIIIYAFAGISITISVIKLRETNFIKANADCRRSIADIAITNFAGIWTASLLLFYTGRSVDGTLRVLLLPSLISVLGTLKLTLPSPIDVLKFKNTRTMMLPLISIALLPVALLIKAPNPHENWRRAGQLIESQTWSARSTKERPIAKSFMRLSGLGIKKIGVMDFDGNALTIALGAKNVLAVNSLGDLSISSDIKEAVCSKLELSDVNYVLLNSIEFNNSEIPCPGMSNPQIQPEEGIILFDYSSTTNS